MACGRRQISVALACQGSSAWVDLAAGRSNPYRLFCYAASRVVTRGRLLTKRCRLSASIMVRLPSFLATKTPAPISSYPFVFPTPIASKAARFGISRASIPCLSDWLILSPLRLRSFMTLRMMRRPPMSGTAEPDVTRRNSDLGQLLRPKLLELLVDGFPIGLLVGWPRFGAPGNHEIAKRSAIGEAVL